MSLCGRFTSVHRAGLVFHFTLPVFVNIAHVCLVTVCGHHWMITVCLPCFPFRAAASLRPSQSLSVCCRFKLCELSFV